MIFPHLLCLSTIPTIGRPVPENIHMSDIILTDHVIFRNIYVYTYVHITKSNENKAMNLKENKEYMREFE